VARYHASPEDQSSGLAPPTGLARDARNRIGEARLRLVEMNGIEPSASWVRFWPSTKETN